MELGKLHKSFRQLAFENDALRGYNPRVSYEESGESKETLVREEKGRLAAFANPFRKTDFCYGRCGLRGVLRIGA